MKRHVAVYLEDAEIARLRSEAAKRRISLSRHLKERLTDSPVSDVSEESGPAPLDEKALERAVRAALMREVKAMAGQMNLLTAMLDQLALSLLINLPEIVEAHKQQAITAGKRRHQGWRAAVEELLREAGTETALPSSAATNGAHA